MKTCSKCKISKNIGEFNKHNTSLDGRTKICLSCKINATRPDPNLKSCTKCLKLTKLEDFPKDVTRRDKLGYTCKLCHHGHTQNWYKNNKISHNIRVKKRIKERKKTDINFKIASYLRTRLYDAVKHDYKVCSAVKDLGCSIKDFKIYMETLFDIGMTWDNWSQSGWHIDHIIPLSSAKTPKDFIPLCHYTNLQPLWAKDNMSKGNRYVRL